MSTIAKENSAPLLVAFFVNGDTTQCIQPVEGESGEQSYNHLVHSLIKKTEQHEALIEQHARQEERARIARDLHDSVKQQVFALSLNLSAALSQLEQKREGALQYLVEADNLASQVQQALTLLILELRSPLLEKKGLPTALTEYAATWSRQNAIPVEVCVPSPCLLSPTVEDALFRITQEALSNIARHSQATHVEIALEHTSEKVQLSISDNGRGFDATSVGTYCVGLHSMEERVEELGGTIKVRSEIGEGTRILIQCPLTTESFA